MSAPFVKERFTFTNPDGSQIDVVGTGDEYYAVFETMDGQTIVKDPSTGFFQYASLSEDGKNLLPSGLTVKGSTPGSLNLPKHLRVHPRSARVMAHAARKAFGPKQRWEIRRKAALLDSSRSTPDTGVVSAPPTRSISGTYVGLCLLIEFPDVPATFSQQEVSDFCNLSGYSRFGNNGSVYDYFQDNSGGRLLYTNIVTVHYTARNNRSYYTDPNIPYVVRAQELIVEVLNSLVADGFDFDRLSADSLDFVYALNVLYAGTRDNNWAEGLWPHSSALAVPFKASSKRKFSDYQITDMGNELSLRTFCHENGHMLCDYPDLYDYGYESTGTGDYCLMAYGANNKNPAQICAYLKYKAGWAGRIATVSAGTNIISSTGNEFFICPNPKRTTEYFLIENRQQAGRDIHLPDAGLAIWHIDEKGSNDYEQIDPSQHYECALEQADGLLNLENGQNYGDRTDLFGSPDAVSFNALTVPNSNWWDGTSSGLNLDKISKPGQSMSFWVPGFIHISPIQGHPMEADIDISGLGYPAKFAVIGDFDGDGHDEIAVAPDTKNSEGNDFWVMKFDSSNKSWYHLSQIPEHGMQADIDFSGLGYPAKFAVVGDFDGDGRDEIAVAPDTKNSEGNDFWVMKFDSSNKSWYHLSQIPGHGMQADIDFSGLGYPAKFAVVGDFDGDGRDEIAVAPDANNSEGNDFWVMKFDSSAKSWYHLSQIPGHGMQADIDFSELGYPAKFAVVGDFDGDGRDEIAVAPDANNSEGNDFWVMKFDSSAKTWYHLSQIPEHGMQADIDFSGLGYPARFAVVGDFDGDGLEEIAVGPEASGSAGNDFWVMKFDYSSRTWYHLCPLAGHSMQADIDFSSIGFLARFAVAGKFDGTNQNSIATAPNAGGSAGNDLWVVKYINPVPQLSLEKIDREFLTV